MRQNVALLSFNRGIVSRLALARADLKRMALSAEIQLNWMPRALGSMMLRPGLGYLGSTYADAAARFIPFVFSASDKALLEFTENVMRVWVNDALVTRPFVRTVVTNGDFAVDLTGWTDSDEAGGASTWASGSLLQLLGNGTAAAIRDQEITTLTTDVEHAIRIDVYRGPVTLRVGTAIGLDDYISETELGTGYHSLTLTPTGNFWIRFQSRLARAVLISECNIEAAGAMQIITPWAAGNLRYMRYDQSGDIVYIACRDLQQWKIERRSTTSWSVVTYQPNDGPFRVENVGPITMTPGALTGNTTLTASSTFFRATHVGALFSVTSTGQTVTKTVSAQNQFSDPIEISSVGTDRAFQIACASLTGTGTTITLQRSFGAPGTWEDVEYYTTDTNKTLNDGFDNQVVYYRIGCKTGGFGAATGANTLSVTIGNIRGICRVTSYTSATSVGVEVLEDFGGTTATDIWEEGRWSDFRGWPSAVALYEGRLWWGGKDRINGGVSDGYESYDNTVIGDSGPIDRSIGRGSVESINWMLPLQRLILGGQNAEHSCRSSSLDEPLTPTNFNIKPASTQGSAPASAVQIDSQGIYVQRGGSRVYELAMDGSTFDYASTHLSALIPEIGKPGIVRMAVQRQPDTRVHFIRSDGTAAVLVFDKVEQVVCWVEVETPGADGLIEDVVVLPSAEGEEEDHVYYVVFRTVNGLGKRYLERWATEDQCRGGNLNMLADSYVVTTGKHLTGLDHLEGEEVVVWGNGKDIGTDTDGSLKYTVLGGEIMLEQGYQYVVVGLYYEARFKSSKLVQIQAQLGTPLTQHKRISGLGLIMADVHPKGLQFGPDFDNMDELSSTDEGAIIDPDTIRTDYDGEAMIFPGTWSTDSRLCLKAVAPRPCTILAAVCDVEMNE